MRELIERLRKLTEAWIGGMQRDPDDVPGADDYDPADDPRRKRHVTPREYDPNDGDLDYVQFRNWDDHLRLEFWYESDTQMASEGGRAEPEEKKVKDLEAAIAAVNADPKLDTKLTKKDEQEIRDFWEKEVVKGREGNITLYFTTKGKKTRFDHLDIAG